MGIMPSFAKRALDIAMGAARLAGMAKKRWRDDDPTRMSIVDVRRIRSEINAAFDDLERDMLTRQDRRDCVVNPAGAAATYETHGLLGLTALALLEESGELAEPLAGIAKGSTTVYEVKGAIEDEAADLRTWLHLVDTTIGIDPVATTQSKWERAVNLMGTSAIDALTPRRLDQQQIAASMAALARSGKE